MLCIEGCPLYGPDAWDIPHENRSSHDSERCIKAAISMVNSYYGGHLSQDRIAYFVYHETLGYESPQNDLGHGKGIIGLNLPPILSWALNGASVARMQGKPGFDEIKYWIDHNIPIIRDHGDKHWMTVIDGYDTEGQMIHVIDPLTASESSIPHENLDVFVVWIAIDSNITARSDEPTIWIDSDGDGVVDFDEINRFRTDPYNNDTYGLGIGDKAAIRYMYIDHVTFPMASFRCFPERLQVNEEMTFNASESKGNITTYEWDFGDGNITVVTEPIVHHTYDQLGMYNVTLTVRDSNGLRSIATSLVVIRLDVSGSKFECAFYRQSLDRRGYASTEGPETPDLLWMSSLNDSVTTSPAIADGMVFVGTMGGKFYAIDLRTGEINWTYDAGSPISSSPAFRDGVVFFGTGEPGKIYAVDAYTGVVRWAYPIPGGPAVYSSPAVVDSVVVLCCSDGAVVCLDQWEGHVLWVAHLGATNLTSPAIQNNTAFVTSSRGVHAIDMSTGTVIWENATRWPVSSCPAVADGLVFVGAENDDRVYALEQSSGNQVWSFRAGGWFTSAAVDSSKQLVIVGCKDLRLYCLDEHTGDRVWEYINGPNYESAPTISANGLVYVGSVDGNLYCVEEDTGREVWRYNVSAAIVSSPSVIYEHVVIGSADGNIYCFGPPFPVHNIAVSDLTLSRLEVGQGHSLEMNTTVENRGDSVETFNITIFANGTSIKTREMVLVNGSSTTVSFVWNTTGFACGIYSINASAWAVPDETDTTDNYAFGGWVLVTMLGDLNGDLTVDIFDAITLASAYGSELNSPNWNLSADLNEDHVVDIYDAIILASHYEQHYS
jgi:outer membrane protein assembly factor BamB